MITPDIMKQLEEVSNEESEYVLSKKDRIELYIKNSIAGKMSRFFRSIKFFVYCHVVKPLKRLYDFYVYFPIKEFRLSHDKKYDTKVYYYPFVVIKKFPTVEDIVYNLQNREKMTVYKTKSRAYFEARQLECDDDVSDVATVIVNYSNIYYVLYHSELIVVDQKYVNKFIIK